MEKAIDRCQQWDDTDVGFSDKDFKAATIKMLEQAITNILETKLK